MSSQLYVHGDILTMEDENPYVEAVFVKNGCIQKIGKKKEVEAYLEEDTKIIDLEGKTMLPSFIDAHSHITAFAQTLAYVNLSSAKSIEEIIQKLQVYIKDRNLKEGEWVIGFGYDHNFLKEKRHPNKLDLDKISIKHPILISHASGHMGVTNSLGLEKMHITDKTKDPEGGSYGRIDHSEEPDGYMEETAFMQKAKVAGNMTTQKYLDLLEEAQEIYLKNGITTVQDGLTKQQDFEMLKQIAQKNRWKVDIVSYVDMADNKQIVQNNPSYVRQYQNHLKIGGYKIILDGSPQGRTAWLSEPYEGEVEYRGYPSKTEEQVKKCIQTSLEEHMQLLAHCNGDAAAQQYIESYVEESKQITDVDTRRPVMIHAQTVRNDQLQVMKQVAMIPSFFIAHTYYWGDVHIRNLGEQRAKRISPAKEAVDLNLCFTFHQDTPVIQPNMLETIWCAVNRKTKEGMVLGEEQCISVYEALKAVTIYAAYQYFEEGQKGSIKEGKKAQFVLLDKNPLKVPKEEINQIQVMQTIYE
ncbi:MAG: amidohydrolase [Clostridia bacterium]